MTREELDFIGSMNMCDEISNEAYKKIVCHCEGQEPCLNTVSRSDMLDAIGHSMSYTSEDLQKIIKALPPVNPQPYEDAISREDALMCLTGEWTEITDEIIHRFIKRIKALPPVNPQPYEDAISREATLKPYNGLNDEDTISVWLIRKNIKQQPPVNPQPKWIPVSEGLPKIADVYRVTRYFPNNVMNPKYLVDACFFDGSNTWYNDNRINHERNYANNVIAWQENPEPYEPQESEDKG